MLIHKYFFSYGLFYLVNDKEPFTGEIISYVAGKVEFEGEVKNGLGHVNRWTG
ncbi:MAG: hypothetical protein HQ542_10100 [Bacteroidia bacterium]|nr:hypothetical protein [Bacteroidia bacterium]